MGECEEDDSCLGENDHFPGDGGRESLIGSTRLLVPVSERGVFEPHSTTAFLETMKYRENCGLDWLNISNYGNLGNRIMEDPRVFCHRLLHRRTFLQSALHRSYKIQPERNSNKR